MLMAALLPVPERRESGDHQMLRTSLVCDNCNMPSTEPVTMGQDGWWWWDGHHWMPSQPHDPQWTWNGSTWSPTRSREPTPRWYVRDTIIWAFLLVAWYPTALWMNRHHASDESIGHVAVALGVLAILSTLIFGGLLGFRRLWKRTLHAALWGTGTLVVAYVLAMVTAPDPTGTNDDAAAVGLIILGIPAALVLTLLLLAGASFGRSIRALLAKASSRA